MQDFVTQENLHDSKEHGNAEQRNPQAQQRKGLVHLVAT